MTETCGATTRQADSAESCQLPAGWGTDHVGEGRCKLHGGAANNRGENNGNYKHGAWSKYADYDDDVLESVAQVEDDLAVLEELRNERLAQYYTVLQYYAETEGVQVAQQILDKIDSGEDIDRGMISELARVMQVSTQSMDNLIARIQSLTNDIADRRGDLPRTVREEHSLDDDALDRLSESIDSAYGES